jgi:hypothetical protein
MLGGPMGMRGGRCDGPPVRESAARRQTELLLTPFSQRPTFPIAPSLGSD